VKASDDYPCGIDITVEGPWLHTILFEIPLLEIVSEVYFRRTYPDLSWEEGDRRLAEKIRMLREEPTDGDLFISDFGSRRRFSKAWHEHMLREVKKGLGPMFTGTSNVMFAQKLGLIPHGTMAHEYLQAFQSLGPRLRDSQRYAFEMWAKEYRGDLGIALSDVYGIEPFLKDFDMYFCKLFDGVRHDSGDPMVWGERMIEHWKKNRCDPRSKTLVFSDALNIPRVIELYRHYHRRCRVAFGVGTNLTNDLGPGAAQHRAQDDRGRRPARRQDLRHAREGHVRRRELPQLPEARLRHGQGAGEVSASNARLRGTSRPKLPVN
jgi:nicotinate phosphoribosyltransferase